MTLNDKCLLVVKPKEPMHHWLSTVLQSAEEELKKDFAHCADEKVEISLEQMQADANCYVLPIFPPKETAAYLEKHVAALFGTELNTWCSVQTVWPEVNFSNFMSSFNLDFFFNWMNFQSQEIADSEKNLSTLVLLIKPNEKFLAYLRTTLTEKFKLPEAAVQLLDLAAVQEASTAVISDIQEVGEVEYFLDQHAEEIFHHQLLLWGGKDLDDSWSEGFDLRAFREYFTIEIHSHIYLMMQ